MAYKPIEDYGIIGDMNAAALVGLDGAIDFFCYPDFDSPSVFAALLDDEKGGSFRICAALEGARQSQLYVPDTNVLLTRSMSNQGILEITDFMPIPEKPDQPSRIIRMARAVRGEVPVSVICKPAFGYGRSDCKAELEDDGHIAAFTYHAEGQSGRMRLHCSEKMALNEDRSGAIASVTLKTGEQISLIFNCGGEQEPDMSSECLQCEQDKTIRYWHDWISQITYRGRWRDAVNRSALVLKLLTSRRFGSIVAAPTFSLPEAIGGRRNWDYRYCWIRDSAFTVYAFIRLGLKGEAIAFMKWIEELYKQSEHGELQLMYRIDGGTSLREETLDNFEGYRRSKPVRVGNDAYKQFQLDLYGELLDCIALADNHITKISHDVWENVANSVEFVCQNWREPDAGIWEFRGGKREFLHSRLMCWVALDRAMRIARNESLPAPMGRWNDVRSEIYNNIFDNFWDDDMQAFVQHIGTKAIDAAVLLMPLVDFIGTHDPRWLSTLRAVDRHLACDALVHRYTLGEIDLKPVDSSQEGSFNACSFWYISCLARAGQLEKAALLFSKMTGYANHLGLFAEETGQDGSQLGNFPQALTHLAMINAVIALTEAENTERAPTE